MHGYSINRRLLYGIWLLLLFILGLPFLYLGLTLRENLERDVRNASVTELNTVRWLLSDHPPFSSYAELSAWAKGYEKASGVRFSYIVQDRLVADSNASQAELERHAYHGDRPEILAARRAGAGGIGTDERVSETVKKKYVYAAAALDAPPGLEPGFLRIAWPSFLISEKFTHLYLGLGLIFLVTFVAAGFLCSLLARALVKNVRDMADAAQAIGQGEYGRRLHDPSWRELQPLATAINSMAHNIQDQLTALTEQNERLQALFNGMRDGVMILDRHGKIQAFNASAERFFPDLKRLKDASPMQATMIPELQECVDALRGQAAAPAQESRPRVFLAALPDGARLEIAVVPFHQAGAQGLVAVFADVSERERVEQLRRDFVANVSHEIKTPLTSIRGYAELLLDNADMPADQRNAFLRIIVKNVEHMVKIAASLLVLAKAEHTPQAGHAGTVELLPLLREAMADFAPALRFRPICLELLPPLDANAPGPLVCGTEQALSEVFHNLLDNALHYGGTEQGVQVTVRQERLLSPVREGDAPAAAAQGAEGTMHVVVRIRDFGPGIPAEARDRVFERFYRLEQSGRKEGRSGLGLSICKRIIRSFGGLIWADAPDAGPGAVLAVALRVASGQEPDASNPARPT